MTREEAIKILSIRDGHGIPSGYIGGYAEAIDIAIEALEAEPIKHAHWIKENKVYPELPNDGDYYWYCSECRSQDQHNINVEVPFCWHCGAKMDEVEE